MHEWETDLHYFITGHNGFKGSWLTLLLSELGHKVSGYSIAPRKNSLFVRADLGQFLADEWISDIRDEKSLASALSAANPDYVIHLAAQPLVQYSYLNPRETYEVNVMGTLNLLEALTSSAQNPSSLIVTTDKVYTPSTNHRKFVENDPLGGFDPYSASKSMADILTQSWSFANPDRKLSIARAGNVIGGGDDSAQRLIPDITSAYLKGEVPNLRHPGAVRPWQHVLDCLQGYLSLVENTTRPHSNGAWNFGPDDEDNKSVLQVLEKIAEAIGTSPLWNSDEENYAAETSFLTLDSTKAKKHLGWSPKWDFSESIRQTVMWEKAVFSGENALRVSKAQVRNYLDGN